MTTTADVKLYYSPSARLVIGLPPERNPMSGEVIHQKVISFWPMGQAGDLTTPWGIFQTNDAEMIEVLEKRKAEVGDVYDTEGYLREITPAKKQLEMAEERLKELEHGNRLLEVLRQTNPEEYKKLIKNAK